MPILACSSNLERLGFMELFESSEERLEKLFLPAKGKTGEFNTTLPRDDYWRETEITYNEHEALFGEIN